MSPSEWKVPPAAQPKPQNYAFDLDGALSAVLALTAAVPADAFTAGTLGTERAGNAVHLGQGLVLTIGYLATEASALWLTAHDGRVVPGHVLAVDGETGFGLVQALGRLDVPSLSFGESGAAAPGDRVVVAGAGGRRHAVAARIVMKQEFAGYWEYLLEEAIFTAPAHPHWGGTALIGEDGRLLGIGSLQLQGETGQEGGGENLNMIVPIDLLKPIMADMLRLGRADRPVRPWLGLFAAEVDGRVAVAGTASGGPAETAGLRTGDIVLDVAGRPVPSLAGFFRAVWGLGAAGTVVPLTIHREGRTLGVRVASTDRARLLKRPVLH